MRCYICNAVINEPSWNKDHGDYDPCGTCQNEINEVLAQFNLDDEEVLHELEEQSEEKK